MHTTDTIDYGVVVRGEMTLELDDGQKVHLRQGDCIVQNGTRHRWRNPLPEPCLMAFISVHVQQQKLKQLAVDLAAIPEILEGYGLTGSADLFLRVVAVDAEDLFRINGKILSCEGVDRTDTALAMGELIPFRIQPLLERNSAESV